MQRIANAKSVLGGRGLRIRWKDGLPAGARRRYQFGYNAARKNANARLDFRPAVIVYCASIPEVAQCVQWAKKRGMQVALRSGGHDYEGASLNNGGMVIDVSRYSGVTPSSDGSTAWIRAGSSLHTMYRELAVVGRTLPGGTCGAVGLAGSVTGGGFGMLVRRHGLLSDHLCRVRLVDAAGSVRDTESDPNGEELLWATRGGGGGSFGVVMDLQFELVELPRQISTFSLEWPWSAKTCEAVTNGWMELCSAAREVTSVLLLLCGDQPSLHVFGQYLGPPRDLDAILHGLVKAAKPSGRSVEPRPYLEALDFFDHEHATRQCWKMKSSIGSSPLGASGIAALISAIENGPRGATSAMIQFNSLSGALGDVGAAATAFPHRDALYSVQYQAYWNQAYWTRARDEGRAVRWLREAFEKLDPHTARKSYRNYADLDLADWQDRYFGANYPRLRTVKTRCDPENLFRFPQSIEPLDVSAAPVR